MLLSSSTNVMKGITELAAIEHHQITPYHPQGNDAAKCHVQNVKCLLAKCLDGQISDWDTHLPAIQMGLNIRVVSRHGSTPFSLLYGREWNELKDYRGVTSKPLSEEQLMKCYEKNTKIVFPTFND